MAYFQPKRSSRASESDRVRGLSMKEWVAVALGGMLGSVMRHALSRTFFLIGPAWLPIATLIVNVIGCFAIGAVANWALHYQVQNHWMTIGVRLGLLGGLTTFSSFALDVLNMWHSERATASLVLAAAHVGLGLAAALAGMAVAQYFVSSEPA